jgi:hypothetical protein
MNEEFWSTILLLVVVPLLQQGIKLLQDKTGQPLEKYQNQIISFVLATGMVFLQGGFAGLAVPEWSGDAVSYVESLATVVGSAWVLVMASYEVVWDRLFKVVRLATADKL